MRKECKILPWEMAAATAEVVDLVNYDDFSYKIVMIYVLGYNSLKGKFVI